MSMNIYHVPFKVGSSFAVLSKDKAISFTILTKCALQPQNERTDHVRSLFRALFFLLLSPGCRLLSRHFKGNEWAARIQAFQLQTVTLRFFSDKTQGYKMAWKKEKRLSLYWPKWRGLRMTTWSSERLTTLSAVILSLILILTNALAALLLPLKIKMLILKV